MLIMPPTATIHHMHRNPLASRIVQKSQARSRILEVTAALPAAGVRRACNLVWRGQGTVQ